MKYDFETLVNRRNKYSRKWQMLDQMERDIDPNIPPLSTADYDFKHPDCLIEGFKEYIDEMVFGYVALDDNYYQSFINWTKRRHDFIVKKDWIIDADGVVTSISNSINAFTDVGDGIIIMTPVYPQFEKSVLRNNRKVVDCPLINDNNKFRIDFEMFEKLASKSNNKMLIMCSPHNPVGRVWTLEELRRVAEILSKFNILVVSDELHMDILLDDYKHTIFSKVSEYALNNSIILTSAAKSFNLAGSRTSFVVIANEKIRDIYKTYVKQHNDSEPNAFGFKLFELSYNNCEQWFDEFLNVISLNYHLLEGFLSANLPSIKMSQMEATYLAWLDFSKLGLNDDKLFDFLVNECQIIPTRGDVFVNGGSGYARLNIAIPTKVLEATLNRLKIGIDRLQS